ncbi:MAG: LysM peptidoglycan-binding domain-containing protein [Gemmatimonadetes bacterium]|nr:LysM peptidoglycan-binding domain-containing protein [Gemmatimonadota bacterium]MBT8403214.1 LysM peptidoglycan-binding domain-containing protein [Gemmatimonadota bacterium]NNF38660.1 LysM peptidoglycan-binding domain-containing protein [Gemmatimonadota bacterium]NNK64987.1 LysM peptidoglycan-binding domain-containing protein [Gemmatimonadota bacterium]
MRVRRVAGFALLAAGLVSGCTRVGTDLVPDSPQPLPEPVLDAPPVPREQAPAAPVMIAPPPELEVAHDPVLHSRFSLHPVVRERVDYWVDRYAIRDGHAFPVFLERMSAYEALVDSALAAEGLPRSLRYLPIIESGYVPSATSSVSAAGLWQFMAPVARSFGMYVSTLVDERRDPVKSTVAAARFLRQLEERFGSWYLALAAYNSGPNRVDRLLRQHAPLAPQGDSLFTVIHPHLPSETRDFVPKLIAAATVAERLDAFGLEAPRPAARYVFDEVTVPDATSLDVVAAAVEVDEDEIRRLNPHLVRGLTPRGRPTVVRLPPGTAEGFLEAWARIPADRRVTVTEHVVAPGETLGAIAREYGVRTADLQSANPMVRPRRMRIGARLVVPRAGSGPSSSGRGSTASGAPPASGEHVVRSGDSLWTIARRYGVSVGQLRSWNGLREGAVLQPGDRLRLAG